MINIYNRLRKAESVLFYTLRRVKPLFAQNRLQAIIFIILNMIDDNTIQYAIRILTIMIGIIRLICGKIRQVNLIIQSIRSLQMIDTMLNYVVNNPIESAACFLIVCFALFLVRMLFSSKSGYNTNENNIRRWGQIRLQTGTIEYRIPEYSPHSERAILLYRIVCGGQQHSIAMHTIAQGIYTLTIMQFLLQIE